MDMAVDRGLLAAQALETLEALVAGPHVTNQRSLIRRRIPHACSGALTLTDAHDEDAPESTIGTKDHCSLPAPWGALLAHRPR